MPSTPLRYGNTAVKKQTQSLPSQSLYFVETDKERHITCQKVMKIKRDVDQLWTMLLLSA